MIIFEWVIIITMNSSTLKRSGFSGWKNDRIPQQKQKIKTKFNGQKFRTYRTDMRHTRHSSNNTEGQTVSEFVEKRIRWWMDNDLGKAGVCTRQLHFLNFILWNTKTKKNPDYLLDWSRWSDKLKLIIGIELFALRTLSLSVSSRPRMREKGC